jgi:hypothetical protein
VTTPSLVPGLSYCTGGPDARILHARVIFGGDGTLYIARETLNGYGDNPGDPLGLAGSAITAIPVVATRDLGATWTAASPAVPRGALIGVDHLAADLTDPSAALVVWHAPEPSASTVVSRVSADGATWRSVVVPAANPDALPFNRLIVDDDGTWHLLQVVATFRNMAGIQATAQPLTHRLSHDRERRGPPRRRSRTVSRRNGPVVEPTHPTL